jgi:DNA-binding transcriptional regulator PaaX
MNSGKTRDVSKKILKALKYVGLVTIAATSPKFNRKIISTIAKEFAWELKNERNEKERLYNAFYRLDKKGYIKTIYHGSQLHISLTEEGKQYLKKYQFDDLKIIKPKKWDKKWRVLIFDIKEKQRIKREALRGKLKELELYKLQESVWVHPYDFQEEINLLRDFFGLSKDEMRVLIVEEIEDDKNIKLYYNL